MEAFFAFLLNESKVVEDSPTLFSSLPDRYVMSGEDARCFVQ